MQGRTRCDELEQEALSLRPAAARVQALEQENWELTARLQKAEAALRKAEAAEADARQAAQAASSQGQQQASQVGPSDSMRQCWHARSAGTASRYTTSRELHA